MISDSPTFFVRVRKRNAEKGKKEGGSSVRVATFLRKIEIKNEIKRKVKTGNNSNYCYDMKINK